MKKVTNTHSPTQNTTKTYWSSFFVVPLFIFLMVITQCEDPGPEVEEPWPWYLKRVTYTVSFVDAFTGEPLANRDVCVGRSFQVQAGIKCDTLKKTDNQGQLSGVMLMEVGHAIGFTLPYLGLLSGYNIATPEGRDYIWEYQKSGVENYNLNRSSKLGSMR